MYGLHVVGYVGIVILVSAITSPTIFGEDLRADDFLTRSNEDITRLLFRNSVDNETNYIFSPFGYSMILAVLSEGARGETRDQLRRILHSPPDEAAVRQTFRNTLRRMQGKNGTTNGPEYRNYFYVYKNYTVDEDYKRIMLEHYFTQVRSVEKPDFYDAADSDSDSNVDSDSSGKPAGSGTASQPVAAPARKTAHERMKRWAKRFLGIDLDAPHRPRTLSNVSAGRLHSASGRDDELLSKMIVFNGLYFNGAWKTPFQVKTGREPFYTSSGHKVMTRMMYSVGQFHVGRIPRLGCTAIRLPYKGERYSFSILYADDANGTRHLMRRVDELRLTDLRSGHLEPRHAQISIPPFEFDSVTYLQQSLKSIGIGKIFSREADFQGLSRDKGLFVDDVVQLVTIKVDGEMAAPNFLTASSVQTRTVAEKLTVDRPFVFLVQDHKDDLVIAAGKLHLPTGGGDDGDDQEDDNVTATAATPADN